MTALNEGHRARIEAALEASPEDFELSLEELLGQFEEFSDNPGDAHELSVPGSGSITVAMISSEAGDSELHVLPGALSARELAIEIFLQNPSWWGEPDFLIVEELQIHQLQG